ncbi:MAG: hypothetical protein QNJ73_09890 [Gammaproteobacteria bacterium]|nr:hypothetical protein [Gammaproteobacteria bacterium]
MLANLCKAGVLAVLLFTISATARATTIDPTQSIVVTAALAGQPLYRFPLGDLQQLLALRLIQSGALGSIRLTLAPLLLITDTDGSPLSFNSLDALTRVLISLIRVQQAQTLQLSTPISAQGPVATTNADDRLIIEGAGGVLEVVDRSERPVAAFDLWQASGGLTADPFGRFELAGFELRLYSESHVFEGTPILPPPAEEFDEARLRLTFRDGSNIDWVDLPVTSLTIANIPIPAGSILFASALGLVGWLKRRPG